MAKIKVLFLCINNSARSQIAEGLLKSLYGEYYEVESAGTNPTMVNPYAIEVLAEIGVDISECRSKSLNEFEGFEFDYVATVCGGEQRCPFFPGGTNYIHQSFHDPAEIDGSNTDKTNAFRRTRDEIKEWITKTFISRGEMIC